MSMSVTELPPTETPEPTLPEPQAGRVDDPELIIKPNKGGSASIGANCSAIANCSFSSSGAM